MLIEIVFAVIVLIVISVVAGAVVVARRDRRLPGGGVGDGPHDRGGTAVREAPLGEPRTRAVDRAGPGLGQRVRSLFGGGQATEETWRELEEALVRADVGPKAAKAIVERVRQAYRPSQDPAEVLAREIAGAFEGDQPWSPPEGSPGVVMVVGVNGTGKTTTVGKLAYLLQREGRSVSLAASDTFRAAAGEQLETWAARSGAQIVAQERGADPAAVAFDAVQSAKARGTDVLIVDTAGRLHTRQPLMEELSKVKRVLEKAAGGVDEVLLVLDATTGQNGIAQARAFTESVGVTGLVLAKMDGTARGGIVLAVRDELGVPVKLVGTGEGVGDLAPFDPQSFGRRLVA
jgi:fused signal recognition particle receptor